MSAENGTEKVVVRRPKPLSRRDPFRIAQAFANSGLFPGLTAEAAAVKIIAGEELGIGAMAAIKGIDIIKGNLGYRGNLVATLVKQHPSYEYVVLEKTTEKCTLQFLIDGEPAPGDEEGKSTFTLEDAKTAQLVKDDSNWKKYPRAMCFNRALTEGVRAYIPDVTAGTPAYTIDEIEDVVEAEVVEEPPAPADEAQDCLDPAMVEHLTKGIELVKPHLADDAVNWLDGLNLILGSIGVDAFEPDGDLGEQFAKLDAEEADALDAQLQALADPEEVDGEVVEESEPAGDPVGAMAQAFGGEANADS